jgi:hypothetical protein
VVLVTNDLNPRSSRVPIPVEGKVASALSVSPNPLLMGAVEEGKTTAKSIVIKAKTPFHIRSAKTDDKRFSIKTSDEAEAVHVVSVTFAPEDSAASGGTVSAKIRIETDLPGAPVAWVTASVRIVTPTKQNTDSVVPPSDAQ